MLGVSYHGTGSNRVSIRTRLNLNAVVLLILAVVLSGPGAGVSAAPFKADKLSVLMTEDSSARGRAKLTSNQENILRGQDDASIRKFVMDHGGELRVIDPSNNVAADLPWVALAMTAAKTTTPPSIIAASPRGGFSLAIAPDAKAEDLTKKLASIAK